MRKLRILLQKYVKTPFHVFRSVPRTFVTMMVVRGPFLKYFGY